MYLDVVSFSTLPTDNITVYLDAVYCSTLPRDNNTVYIDTVSCSTLPTDIKASSLEGCYAFHCTVTHLALADACKAHEVLRHLVDVDVAVPRPHGEVLAAGGELDHLRR